MAHPDDAAVNAGCPGFFVTADEHRDLNFAPDRPGGLPARVRVVRFHHDPVVLRETLSTLEPPPDDLAEGVFHLVIDCRTGDPEFRLLDANGAAALRELGLI